jgi:hypothetical protein
VGNLPEELQREVMNYFELTNIYEIINNFVVGTGRPEIENVGV